MIGSIVEALAARRSTDLSADARSLRDDLRRAVRGEVRFDPGGRALYATDASNYRQVPIGVVLPRDLDDVTAAVEIAHHHGAPVLPRGGGTSLAGQCCSAALVLDFSRHLDRVLEIDPARRRAKVQPGTVLDTLRDAAERFHLTYGPDPATHNRCTIGGMLGNNSCGVHSLMAGMTDENVEEMEVLTYDGLRLRVGPTSNEEAERIVQAGGRRGEIYRRLRALRDRYGDQVRRRFPDIPRRVSGYNLPALLPENGFDVARALVGTEGTCVTVLQATLRLVPSPPARTLVALGYPDVYSACDDVPRLLTHHPVGLEGFDDRMVRDMRRKNLLPRDVALLPDGGGWLLVEFGGDSPAESESRAEDLVAHLGQSGSAPRATMVRDRGDQARLWAVRESALGATAIVPGQPPTWPGWEDSSVPPARLGAYLRDLRKLMEQYRYDGSFYGHFGQGCLHLRLDFDFQSEAGRARFRAFVEQAADLVVSYGGSLSGEHGDGQARAELLPRMFGADLVQAFREFKAIWDPDNRMNPGKVVAPARVDENLRLAEYQPREPATHFQFPDDGGSFAHAAMRCVGVGLCRRHGGGTMCPSYMVTHQEEHSTRGRARLLFEMLQGGVIRDRWRDEHVRQALDLCLACKGCKGDCPVNVDMATYKAEFLSHYYAGRLRPRSAYAFGLIMYWAHVAAAAPAVANAITQTPILKDLARLAAGIDRRRNIPRFASQTFKAWFRRRVAPPTTGRRVILWADTFNNHFHPETAQAAVEVLEAAGCQVLVPDAALCCGRPVYDYGMLDLAERLLRRVLTALGPEIDRGTPVVGLEPSCVAVFRDELVGLFPRDARARRLSEQTYLLDEFLAQQVPDFHLPKLGGHALLHGHCHQKALLGMDAAKTTLKGIGMEVFVPDTGCCGMAGGFGFEQGEHYDVAQAAGERVLLPAVRSAATGTLVVADGFSCREQIAQGTGQHAVHLAEALKLALQQAPGGTPSASAGIGREK